MNVAFTLSFSNFPTLLRELNGLATPENHPITVVKTCFKICKAGYTLALD